MSTHEQNNDDDSISFIHIIIDFVKDELLKSNIRTEIIKPILLYLLYYIIPFAVIFVLLNFLINIEQEVY
jgi:hypothetical protein